MTQGNNSRRRFLVATIAYSGLISAGAGTALFRAGAAWAQSSEKGAAELVRLARLLYPHDGVADDVYLEVIEGVLSDSTNDPIIDSAMTALNAAQSSDWFELDTDAQVAAMKSVETESFFEAIRVGVRDRFYTHPKVWEHIGYPGSSVEFGGYVDRGFDDIDWLPEEA
jgi:hypothetical protein